MATTTPVNGWSIPQLTDPPNIESAVNTFANAVDSRANPIFASPAARDIAIPAPTSGQEAFCTSNGEKYVYTNGLWRGARPRTLIKPSNTVVSNSTTQVDVAGLTFDVETNSKYEVRYWIYFTSTAVANINFKWAGPAGFSGNYYAKQFNAAAVNPDIFTASAVFDTVNTSTLTCNGTTQIFHVMGYLDTAGTAGTFRMTFAQQNVQISNTTVFISSTVKVLKM